MNSVSNWKKILTKGYVAWLVYIGTAAQIVFEFGFGQALPAWVVITLLVLILLGRTVKQESVSGPAEPDREFTGGETDEAR